MTQKEQREIKCPECKKSWEISSEQAKAIKLREKCIACLIKDNEDFNPKDFELTND